MLAHLYPGQSSQFRGMGREFHATEPAYRRLFEQASDIAGRSMISECCEIPDAILRRTERAQPAIFATSVAIAQVLEARGMPKPNVVAGHSLGHFTALVLGGALSFEAGFRLIMRRSALMAQCEARTAGGMFVVNGLALDVIEAVLRALRSPVVVANINTPRQIAISGARESLGEAVEHLTRRGGQCAPLNVSGAYHSPVFELEAQQFALDIVKAEVQQPDAIILSNRDGRALATPGHILTDLTTHMTCRVNWTAVMTSLRERAPETILEVGAGRVLKGLFLRFDSAIAVKETSEPRFVDRLFNTFDAVSRPRSSVEVTQ